MIYTTQRVIKTPFALKTSQNGDETSNSQKVSNGGVQTRDTSLGLNYIICTNYEIHMNLLYAVKIYKGILFEA